MRQVSYIALGVAIGTATALMVGCRHSGQTYTCAPPKMKHIIFDPVRAYSADGTFVRSEWPSLIAHENPDEIVEYAEIIRDDFGRQSGRDDNYRRRFESVRIGRYQK